MGVSDRRIYPSGVNSHKYALKSIIRQEGDVYLMAVTYSVYASVLPTNSNVQTLTYLYLNLVSSEDLSKPYYIFQDEQYIYRLIYPQGDDLFTVTYSRSAYDSTYRLSSPVQINGPVTINANGYSYISNEAGTLASTIVLEEVNRQDLKATGTVGNILTAAFLLLAAFLCLFRRLL